jgi:hypothetical protein
VPCSILIFTRSSRLAALFGLDSDGLEGGAPPRILGDDEASHSTGELPVTSRELACSLATTSVARAAFSNAAFNPATAGAGVRAGTSTQPPVRIEAIESRVGAKGDRGDGDGLRRGDSNVGELFH